MSGLVGASESMIASHEEASSCVAEAAKDAQEDENLRSVLVRVKRRRADLAEAPSVLLLPQKKRSREAGSASREDELTEAFAYLGVEKAKTKADEYRRHVIVCALVRDGESGDEESTEPGQLNAEAHQGAKRKLDDLVKDKEITLKRRRVVDLELSSKGISQRFVPRTLEDDSMDFAIWHALQTGDLHLIKVHLTDKNRDVNFARKVDGVTALMAACSFCDLDLIELLLERGADVELEDKSGFNARDRVGFSLDDPHPALVKKTLKMLNESEYTYDKYVMRERIELPRTNQGVEADTASLTTVPKDIWTANGATTAWHDAPIANFELDLDRILEMTDEDFVVENQDDNSVHQSDLENEDDENYLHNDYPDEESSEGEDEDEEDDLDVYPGERRALRNEEDDDVADGDHGYYQESYVENSDDEDDELDDSD